MLSIWFVKYEIFPQNAPVFSLVNMTLLTGEFFMEELEIYRDMGTTFLVPVEHTNPAQKGHVRRLCILYVIGRFGFSSKVIFEYLLGLPREAINKLFRKLVTENFLNERKSFGSKDGAVYYLSSKGKRYIAFETELEYNQKTDTSSHNSKTEIHDESIKICVIDRLLNSKGQYTAFVTEKELRELGYGTFGELKNQRAVDALLYHNESGQWHALELETANSKNIQTHKLDVRADILQKYIHQLDNDNGLYKRVLFFSHRERFLRQIKSRIDNIIAENKLGLTDHQKTLALNELKYIHSFCPTLYNIFWDPEFKLGKDTHQKIELDKISRLLNNVTANDELSDEYKAGYEKAFTDLKLINPIS